MKRNFIYFFIVILFGYFAGCKDNSNPLTTENEPITKPANINGNLKGRVFVGEDGKYLDLETGTYISFAPNDINHIIKPSLDGKEIVVTVDDYRYVSLGLQTELIAIRDAETGLTLNSFEVNENIWGAAELSPDKQIIAARWEDEAYSNSKTLLTLFKRNGDVIAQTDIEVNGFTWVSDGRIVYVAEQTIYITEPNSLVSRPLKTFGETDGVPFYPAVSPDGKTIIFELVTEFGTPFVEWRDASLWKMNIDGTNLEMFATEKDKASGPKVNAPVWSPDGKWVLAVSGHISGVSWVPDTFDPERWRAVAVGVAGALWAIPANETNVTIPPEESSKTKPVFRTDGNKVNFVFPGISSYLTWLPPGNINVSAGSDFNTNTVNGGINGTIILYETKDNVNKQKQFTALNLNSASKKSLLTFTGSEYNFDDILCVSKDKNFYSLYDDDSEALTVYDKSGNNLFKMPLKNSDPELNQKGQAKFSPVNNNLLTLNLKYYSGGWKYAVAIIDWKNDKLLQFYKNYSYSDWLPDGNLLLSSSIKNGIYKTDISSSNPTLQFELNDKIEEFSVSPDGTKLALILVGHLYTSSIEGKNLMRATLSDGLEGYPEWSPNGKYIMVQVRASDDPVLSNEYGRVWIISSDARNVYLSKNDDYKTNNAVPVFYKKDGKLKRLKVFGPLNWR